VLLMVDGQPFTSGKLDGLRTGPERLRIVLRRDGAVHTIDVPATAAERAAFADGVALKADTSGLLVPAANGAALAAGMQPGDRIESVGGDVLETFDDLRRAIEDSDGSPLAIVARRVATGPDAVDATTAELRPGERYEVVLTPRRAPVHESGLHPQLTTLTEEVRAESFGHALQLGALLSLDMIKQLYVTLKRMVTGDVGAKNLGGIIRISQVSYQAAQRGPSWFLYLMAMLSLNLAFVNLLPIPVLDGGHLMFLLIEKVKGSPVSSRVFGYSQVVGLVFVLMLVLFVTYNDILQLL
jgi:regulator of sigma E protease